MRKIKVYKWVKRFKRGEKSDVNDAVLRVLGTHQLYALRLRSMSISTSETTAESTLMYTTTTTPWLYSS
jgi:hypothetical protein